MTSSKEVFRLRRAGKLEAAYKMALERIAASDRDAWDDRAYGWCLIDLIKKYAAEGTGPELDRYIGQLQALEVPKDDEIITKQRNYALSLAQPGSQDLLQARIFSKNGQFKQAIEIYAELFRKGSLTPDNHTSYGWDLFKATRLVFEQATEEQFPPRRVAEVKQNLNAYMHLDAEKPSLLHSLMLQQAMRLVSGDHLKAMVFARMWGLENLRPEDFERYVTDDGKTLPSLAEKVVQQASKEAAAGHQRNHINYILPFVEKTMDQFPDNVWLKLNKVKLLRELGRNDEARALALEFARAKANEYWAWDLLGDLQVEPDLRLACYCKALLCSQDDNFVSNLRLKLAKLLAEAGHPSEAKGEAQRVIEHKQSSGHKLPAEIQQFTQDPWYADTVPTNPKPAFYARFAPQTEELLFSDLPWIDACVGGSFVINGKEGKPRRKIFLKLKTASFPAEVSIPETRLRLKNLSVGMPVKVKAEYDPTGEKHFNLFALEPRDSGVHFDIFSETVGIIDHVNRSKNLLHFIASRDAHGVVSLADYDGEATVGDSIALKLATFRSRKGPGIHAISAAPTNSEPGTHIRKTFSAKTRVSNGMGFTDDNIFIPPDLVSANAIDDEDTTTGVAVLNYNKKRQAWGWKAITISGTGPRSCGQSS